MLLTFQFCHALMKTLPAVFRAYMILSCSPARDGGRKGGAREEAGTVLYARKQLKHILKP